VIVGVLLNGLSEEVDGFLVALRLEGLVALVLELGG
jgi:hypothetical protein